ncbi:hypothetical protein [Sphingomonas sp. LT1P40]|uniref:hypothetical protein n=1 Tax=Alteristakelama amylovorans TaxID=3096166 RepID=UPI002FC9FA17
MLIDKMQLDFLTGIRAMAQSVKDREREYSLADPFTLTSIAAGCVWGLIGNRADAAAMAGGRKLASALKRTQTPKNHDVLRATHDAWLKSVQIMAGLAKRAAMSPEDYRALKALKKAVRDPALTAFRVEGDHFPEAELTRLIENIYCEDADPDAVVVELVIERIEGVMGEPLTDELRTVFRKGHASKPGWAATFVLFFSREVSDKGEVFRTLAFERLNEVTALAMQQSIVLAEMDEELAELRSEARENHSEVTALLRQVILNQGVGEQASFEVLRSLADAYGEESHIDNIENLREYLLKKVTEWREQRVRIAGIEADGRNDDLLAQAKFETDKGNFSQVDILFGEIIDNLKKKDRIIQSEILSHTVVRAENAKLSGKYIESIALYDDATKYSSSEYVTIDLKFSAAYIYYELSQTNLDEIIRKECISRWRDLRRHCLKYPERAHEVENQLSICLMNTGGVSSLYEINESIDILNNLEILYKSVDLKKWCNIKANLGIAYRRRSTLSYDRGDLLESIRNLREAIVVAEDVEKTIAVNNYENLGNALRTYGDYQGNSDSFVEAMKWYEKLLASYGESGPPRRLCSLYNNMGIGFFSLGEKSNSIILLRKSVICLSESRAIAKSMGSDLLQMQAMSNMMMPWRSIGFLRKSRRCLDISIAYGSHALQLAGPDSRTINVGQIFAMIGLAHLQIAQTFGKIFSAKEAERNFKVALDIFQEHAAIAHIGHQERNLQQVRALLGHLGSRRSPC